MRAVPGGPSPQPSQPGQAPHRTRSAHQPARSGDRGRGGSGARTGPEGPTSTDRHQSRGDGASAQGTPLGVGARGPRGQDSEQGGSSEAAGHRTPGTRAEAGPGAPMGPSHLHIPRQASSSPQAPGPALRSLSRSREGGTAPRRALCGQVWTLKMPC